MTAPQKPRFPSKNQRSDADFIKSLDRDSRPGLAGLSLGPADEIVRRGRVLYAKHGRTGMFAAALIGIGALAFIFFFKGPNDCTRTPVRERAYEAIRSQKEQVSGEEIGRQFRGTPFRCNDLASPQGTLISVREHTGEPIIWFVDAEGTPRNVNLLAQAWTPALDAAPRLPEDALKRMRDE